MLGIWLKKLFHVAAVMAPLAPKFLRVCEQEFGFVEALGLVTLVPAGGSSQCSGIAGRAALQRALQGRGFLPVPECFCA